MGTKQFFNQTLSIITSKVLSPTQMKAW